MKEIYKSKYSEHIYDDSRSIMFSDWFPETENMDADDFKSEMRKWLDAFKECKPKYLYDRCMDFNYLINPEEQIWMAHLLNPELIKLGLKKYAYLVPEEIFSEASVEQLFDEFKKI
ncbi:MAG: hypothetical protein B6I24_00425 [Bacteroidetes bacterium 4572_128]|nr:MAG: hypothetical protein B6I24_00425 [Bacteroidetes bacterium 4572_128]